MPKNPWNPRLLFGTRGAVDESKILAAFNFFAGPCAGCESVRSVRACCAAATPGLSGSGPPTPNLELGQGQRALPTQQYDATSEPPEHRRTEGAGNHRQPSSQSRLHVVGRWHANHSEQRSLATFCWHLRLARRQLPVRTPEQAWSALRSRQAGHRDRRRPAIGFRTHPALQSAQRLRWRPSSQSRASVGAGQPRVLRQASENQPRPLPGWRHRSHGSRPPRTAATAIRIGPANRTGQSPHYQDQPARAARRSPACGHF